MSNNQWTYTVQLEHSQRLHPTRDGGEVFVDGVVWNLVRSVSDQRGFHILAASPGVFDNDEDAKKDAFEKLSMLRCPFDRPLDRAIKWMLDEGGL